MKSKWHRSIVAVTLVAAFAAGTMVMSGGGTPFAHGDFGPGALHGVSAQNIVHASSSSDPLVVTPWWGHALAVAAGAFLARVAYRLADEITDYLAWSKSSSILMGINAVTYLDESVFD